MDRRARIENIWLQRPVPRIVVMACSCASGWRCAQFRKVYFDYNLLHMQSAGLPAVEFRTETHRFREQIGSVRRRRRRFI